MRKFYKFLVVCGVILFCFSAMAKGCQGTFAYTYSEYKDDLAGDDKLDGLSEGELEMRYEEYLVKDDKFSNSVFWFFFITGMGFFAVVTVFVFLDKLFVEERKKNDWLKDEMQNGTKEME